MKKNIVLLLFTFCLSSTFYAQRIESKKVFGGYQFEQDGKMLSLKDLQNLVEGNKQAFTLVKKARNGNTFATILGIAGGGMVGFPLGTAIGGGDPNWTFAAIGGGLIVVALPLSNSAYRKAKEAVDMYNATLSTTNTFSVKPQLHLITNSNGVGFSLHF
ncbi:hypothetical protein GCM10009117_12190 [Gangjinia marincola]|uniref:Uncharacterized protein n=1 Tax=Gangjinia marincola TaxID=578463 RepID=A0ABN1MFY6_9FLAO